MKKMHGFTLIELLIVVAIIAILAAIAVPNFLEAQVRAKVSRAKTDMRSISVGLEAYVTEHNHYPPSYGYVPGGQRGFLDPNINRLHWITTPVAYLTALPADAFYPVSKAFARAGAVGAVEYYNGNIPNTYPKGSHYTYQYSEDFYAWETHFPARPKGLLDYNGVDVTWHLMSLGPDRCYNFMLPDADPGTATPEQFQAALQLPYDATNGTVSEGDIIRTGGPGGVGTTWE